VSGPHRAPGDELAQQVAAIWQQVLEVERVGLDDNFFELGGHSLLATQVIVRLRGQLGWKSAWKTCSWRATWRRSALTCAACAMAQPVEDELAKSWRHSNVYQAQSLKS
jgi:hypothetical protein